RPPTSQPAETSGCSRRPECTLTARTATQPEPQAQPSFRPSPHQGESTMLEPLFDAELDYQPGMPPLTSDGDGTLIGSGDGAVHGPKLTGKLEWTLFEQPGSTVC